jgi:hypothetical protein
MTISFSFVFWVPSFGPEIPVLVPASSQANSHLSEATYPISRVVEVTSQPVHFLN